MMPIKKAEGALKPDALHFYAFLRADRPSNATAVQGEPTSMQRPGEYVLPSDRSFGLLIAVVFSLVGAWLFWRGSGLAVVAFGLAALLMLVAMAFPRLLHALNSAWMRFGLLLNAVVSPVVMGAIFFGLLTPMAVVMRLRGRDVLNRKFDAARESYWIRRDPAGPDGSSFARQF